MFSHFFYTLREEGIPVSIHEWLALMEALSLDLADNSLTEFYYLARSLLVKSELHFDRYDAAFIKCFGDGGGEQTKVREIPPSERAYNPDFFNPALYAEEKKPGITVELDMTALKGVLEVKSATAGEVGADLQDEDDIRDKSRDQERDGALFSGMLSGDKPLGAGGISFSETSGGMTALKVAGERRFKDYQDDGIRNIRQYEIALRSLRQLSSKLDGPKDELNIEATVEETGRRNGMLSLEWDRPRKNAIKLILLMDSMGSIYYYHSTVQKLFNAAHRSTNFKEIQYFYFHNCIYSRIYKDQLLRHSEYILTEEFFRLYNGEHRLLIIGDARMSEEELRDVGGVLDWHNEYNTEPGYTWLTRVARHYPYAAWLNPVPERLWGREHYESINDVREIFPMYALTPAGIKQAVKRLRVKSGA